MRCTPQFIKGGKETDVRAPICTQLLCMHTILGDQERLLTVNNIEDKAQQIPAWRKLVVDCLTADRCDVTD